MWGDFARIYTYYITAKPFIHITQTNKQTKERETNMKIKNLAFFGVMAAIMGVANAARADATTVIASQAYVDAKDDLKQNLLDSGANGNITKDDTGTTAASRVVTNVTADGQGHVTVVTAPIDVGGDISTAINALDGTVVNNDSGTIVRNVTQTDGVITVEHGTVGTNDIDDSAVTTAKIAGTAVTTAKIADDAVTTAKIMDGNVTMPKTNFTMPQGNSPASWLAAVDETTSTNTYGGKDVLGAAWTQQEGKLQAANAQADKYVPTMGAVNALIVKQSEAQDATKSWAVDNNGTLFTKYKNAGDSYVPTVAAVEKRVQQAETSAGGAVNALDAHETATTNYVVTGVTQTDGLITGVDSAQITTDYIASTALSTAIPSSGAVDTKVATEKAVADAVSGTVSDLDNTDTSTGKAVVAVSTTDGIAVPTRADLDYVRAMNNALKNVNTGSAASCDKGNPCVLTYYVDSGNHFMRWTNMDTDSTDANATAASGEVVTPSAS